MHNILDAANCFFSPNVTEWCVPRGEFVNICMDLWLKTIRKELITQKKKAVLLFLKTHLGHYKVCLLVSDWPKVGLHPL